MANNFPTSFFKTDSPIAVVAGGAGFVGSFVCESLLKKNVRVVCVDDLEAGLKENISEFSTSKNFLLLEKNISARFSKKISKVDYVFHLSCLEPGLSNKDTTVEFLSKVSLGTKNLLDLAKRHEARFLLVLGEGEWGGFAETLALQYRRERGVDVRVVRLGDVYGPKMLLDGESPITKIIKDAVYGIKTVLSNDGQNLSAVFVDDVVGAILRAAFTPPGSVVNVETKTPFGVGLKKTVDWFVDKKIRLVKQEPEEVFSKEVFKENSRSFSFWDNVLKKEDTSPVSKKNNSLKKIFLGLTCGFLFWFVFLPFINLFAGFGSLSLAKRAFLDDDGQGLHFWARGADFWFSASRGGFSQWSELPFFKEVSAEFYLRAGRGVRVARVGTRVFDVLEKSKLVLGGIFGKTNVENLDGKFTNLSSELDRLEQELGFIEAEYGMAGFIAFNRDLIKFSSSLLRNHFLLFGKEGEKRTYVFLFQDPGVMGAVGGAVEPVGIINFESGRFANWELRDEESFDWDPGRKSAYFGQWAEGLKELLEKRLDAKVDGIFYFDRRYKEDVKDFVDDPRMKLTAFVRAFSQALERREMALWVEDDKISSILKTWGYDGSFMDPGCQALPCIQDYLQVAVNSLVDSPKRKYSLEIAPVEQGLSHRLVVSYPEDSDVNEYLMVVVPTKSKKGEAFLVDSNQKNIEIDEYEEGGKKTFGLFVESVDIATKNLIVEWDLPINDKDEEFSFIWQKQLGASNATSEVNFEYSPGIYEFVSSEPSPLLTKEGGLSYNTSLSEDFVLKIKWQAKN